MDAIQVAIRVRPLLKRETEKGKVNQWNITKNTIVQAGFTNPYYFDHVFGAQITTYKIFSSLVQPLVLSVMEGFNSTIFAYGQTSSGKTHTMMGNHDDPGIIPYCFTEMFSFIENHPEREFIIRGSYLEIYNETLTDLLEPGKKIKVREDYERNVKLAGITETVVNSAPELGALLALGQENRTVGETQMNEKSSRSHTIFTMNVESRLKDAPEEEGVVKLAALNLVDLAGSERVSSTGTEGVRFKEGTFINLSLLTLGNVISKLSEGGNSHIPFRNSKLTRILQSSLGGNAKTCMICAIAPTEVGESHSTLKFAGRAKTVKNKPVVNEVLVGEEALRKRLKAMESENLKLRKKMEGGLPIEEQHELTKQVAEMKQEKDTLTRRLKAFENIFKAPSSTASVEDKKAMKRSRQTVFWSHHSSQHFGSPVISAPARKVTFAPMASPTHSNITFDRHQDTFQSCYSPSLACVKTPTMRGRASFIPHMMSTPLNFTADSLDSQEGVEDTQISEQPMMVSVEIQTEAMSPATPPSQQTPATEAKIPSSAEASVLSTTASASLSRQDSTSSLHSRNLNDSLQSNQAAEKISLLQFEVEENRVRIEELEATLQQRDGDLADSEARSSILSKKLEDMESASRAQEDLLLELQERLKESNKKLGQTEEARLASQRLVESTQNQLEEKAARIQQLEEIVSLSGDGGGLDRLPAATGGSDDSTAVATVAMELEHAQEQIERLTADMSRMRESTAVDQKRYHDLLAELEEAKSELEELPALKEELQLISTLKSELQRSTETISEQKEELEKLESELEELPALKEELQLIPTLKSELQRSTGTISEQKYDLERLKSELEELPALKEELQLIPTLKSELKQSTDTISEQKEELEKLKSELEGVPTLSEELQQATRTISEQCKELEKLKSDVPGLRDLVPTLKENLQQATEIISMQAGQLEGLRSEVSDHKDKFHQATETINRQTGELERLQSELEEVPTLRRNLQQATETISKRTEELERLQSELEEVPILRAKLQQATETISERTGELERLQYELDEVPTLRKKLQQATGELERLQSELEEVPTLREKLQQATETISEQNEEMKRLESELEGVPSLRKELLQTTQIINEKTGELEQLKSELEQVPILMKELQMNSTLRDELQQATDTITEQKEEMEKLKSELEKVPALTEELNLVPLRKELQEAVATISEQKEEIERLKSELEGAFTLREKLGQATEMKTGGLETLNGETEKVCAVEKEFHQATEMIHEKTRELERLKLELEEASALREELQLVPTLREELQQATETIRQQKEEMKRHESELEEVPAIKEELCQAIDIINEKTGELEKLKLELEELHTVREELQLVPTLREDLQQANETIKEQSEELERLKFELMEYGRAYQDRNSVPDEGVNNLAQELGGEGVCLSLEEEMRQLEDSSVHRELVGEEESDLVVQLKEELLAAQQELAQVKAQYEEGSLQLVHALEECGIAEEEVVGLRETLVALHRQLKQSPPTYKSRLSFSTATPSRARARRFPLTTSQSYTPLPSKPKLLLTTPTKPTLSPVIETSPHESPQLERNGQDTREELEKYREMEKVLNEQLRSLQSHLERAVAARKEDEQQWQCEIDGLKERNKHLEAEMESLQKRIEIERVSKDGEQQTQKKLEQLAEERDSLSREISALRESLETEERARRTAEQESQREKEQFMKERDEFMKKLETVQKSLETEERIKRTGEQQKQKEIERLVEERDDLLKKLEALQKGFEQKQAEMQQLVEERDNVLKKLKALQENFEAEERAKRDSEQQKQKEINQLEEERGNLLKRLEALQETSPSTEVVQQLEQKLAEAGDRIKALSEESKRFQSKYYAAQAKQCEAEYSEQELEMKVEQLEKELSQRSLSVQAVQNLEQQLAEAGDRIKSLSEESKKFQAKYYAAQEKQCEAEYSEHELEVKVDQLEKERSSLAEVVQKLEQQLSEAGDRIKVLDEESKRFQSKYYAAQDKQCEAEYSEHELELKVDKLEKELKEVQEFHQKAIAQLTQQQAPQEEVLQLKAQLLTNKKEMAHLKQENEELQLKVKDVQEQLKQSSTQSSPPVEEVQQLEKQLAEAGNKIKALSEESKNFQLKYYAAQDKQCEAEYSEHELELKVDQLEKELKELREVHQKTTTQQLQPSASPEMVQKLEQQLAEARDKIKALSEESKRFQLKYYAAQEKQCEAEYSEHELEVKVDQLEKELKEVQEFHQKAMAQLTQQQAPHDEVLRLKAQLLTGKKEVACLKQENEDLNLRIKAVQSKIEEENSSQLAVENQELKDVLCAVRKDNARLTRKVQGMATIPTASGSRVVDGSGMVTGLAFYQLQQELAAVKTERDEVKASAGREKERRAAVTRESDRQRERIKQLHKERNIFRAKYDGVKHMCTCGAVERLKQDAHQSSINSVDSASHSSPKPQSSSARKLYSQPLPPAPPPFSHDTSSTKPATHDTQTSAYLSTSNRSLSTLSPTTKPQPTKTFTSYNQVLSKSSGTGTTTKSSFESFSAFSAPADRSKTAESGGVTSSGRGEERENHPRFWDQTFVDGGGKKGASTRREVVEGGSKPPFWHAESGGNKKHLEQNCKTQ